MFIIAGKFVGEDYNIDGESISLEKVERALSTPLKAIMKAKGNLELRLTKHSNTMSSAAGGLDLVGISNEQPVFTASNPDGSQFTLRWCKTLTRPSKDVVKYFPPRIPLKKAVALNKTTDREMAVFLLLSPRCEQSPFNDGGEGFYTVVDREADSRKQLEALELEQIAIDLVRNSDPIILRMKSHGIVIDTKQGRVSVYDIDGSDNKTIQLQLIKLAKTNPGSFIEQWSDPQKDAFGIIIQAVNAGIMVPTITALGHTRWKWRSDVRDGADIVTIDKTTDAKTGLVNHILAIGIEEFAKDFASLGSLFNSEERQESVKNAVAIVTTPKKLSEMDKEELTKHAIKKGRLVLDIGTSCARFVDEELNYTEQSVEILDKKNWEQEFVSKLDDGLEKSLRAHLKPKK